MPRKLTSTNPPFFIAFVSTPHLSPLGAEPACTLRSLAFAIREGIISNKSPQIPYLTPQISTTDPFFRHYILGHRLATNDDLDLIIGYPSPSMNSLLPT